MTAPEYAATSAATPPQISKVDPGVIASVRRMKERASARTDSMDRARKVRRGEFALVWPDKFSNAYPEPIVANMVDRFARDLAANLAPLPSLACSAGTMKSSADKQRAQRKNRIGSNYWRQSDLETQMMYGADQLLTYGFLPVWVEANYPAKLPRIQILDPIGCYYEMNRFLKVERFARCYRKTLRELAAEFSEYASQILTKTDGMGRTEQCDASSEIEVVQYVDKTVCALFLPDRDGLILAAYNHGQDFCPVHIATRPGVELEPRGQFDDVLWVQLAHAVMAALTLEAGHKAVQAPIAVPSDVQEVPIGPDGIIVTDNPEKVGRITIEVPSAAFALGETLSTELQQGSGVPDTRLGVGPAGGSTGRGISALEGGFDTQIKQGQDILAKMLRCVTEMCFAMDAKLWPQKSKTITGTLSGESFEVTYIPARDIGDSTACEVTYGFAAGLSPNAAIVTMLQMLQAEIISLDTFRRNVPIDIDPDQQEREILEQQVRSGVTQSLLAALQSAGQMSAQGMQSEALMYYQAAESLIRGVRAGKDLPDLIEEVFVTPLQQQVQQAQQAQAAAAQAGGGQSPDGIDGVDPNGLPQGVAPGQAGLPPGGRPSVTDLVAGFTSGGKANLGVTERTRQATG